jgi:hypothetical protein
MHKLVKIIVLCFVITINCCYAQISNTPEVYSFKQEVFRPVSHYTGQTNISIPITEIKTNEIIVPITLNYIGGTGLNPINTYSSIGMGWRVSAGGVITRTKNNICDELPKNTPGNNSTVNGFFSLAPNSVTNTYVRNNINSYFGLVPNGNGDKYFIPQTEYSPDVFSFNFLGYSGYFIMGYDGQFKIQSQDIVSVEKFDGTASFPGSSNRLAFRMVANDGTTFTFGNGTGSMELSGGGSPAYQADAWYLTEIKSVNGRTIKFNYKNNEMANVRYLSSIDANNAICF